MHDSGQLKGLVEPLHPKISLSRQCVLLGLSRSSYYYEPCGESAENLRLMGLMDKRYTERPDYGYRRMWAWLRQEGHTVNVKRVHRLWKTMGLRSLSPQPGTSVPATGHKIYPYLLRGMAIDRPDKVWAADITYVPMAKGFLYLTAVVDRHSRYVLAWKLSNSMESVFCVECLEEALGQGCPEIFNTDQGAQYTSHVFTGALLERDIQVSMDGKGRATDNAIVERLWRGVKYEDIYLKDYADGKELANGMGAYFRYYNHERPHQALKYRTPAEIYRSKRKKQDSTG